MASTVTSGGGFLRQELKGVSQLRRTLREAGADLEDLTEANTRAARVVEEATVGLVPVDTGWLASTIRSSGTKSAGVVRAGNRSTPYAGPIHWGWPARNIAPNPFAADAAKLTEPVWGDIYREAVEKALDKIKGM